MVKDRSTFVKQIIDAELEPGLDSPPQRPIVVIHHVIYDEWILRSQLKGRFKVRTAWIHVARLKREPDLLKRHRFGLIQVRR